MPEVFIIGGGPAGSVAAVLLARTGFAVTLLEQHTFPRDKVCGECLSALGIDVLGRVGLAETILELQPAIFARTLLHAVDGPVIEVPMPRPMWGVSRRAMDALLLDAARDAGAFILQPARCEKVIPGDRPTIRWRCLRTNKEHEAICDWVILAEGKGAFPTGAPPATRDFGIKAHFANVDGPRDAIELFGVDGHYGGLAAIEHHCWNAAFSVPVGRLRGSSGDIDKMFREMVHENPTLRSRLRGATRVSPWLSSPLPRFGVPREFPSHMIPIGNAVAAIEPVGGEGMGLAMHSAELAAEALGSRNPAALSRLSNQFNRIWSARRILSRTIGRVFSVPRLANAISPLADANQRVPRAVMEWMGKL